MYKKEKSQFLKSSTGKYLVSTLFVSISIINHSMMRIALRNPGTTLGIL